MSFIKNTLLGGILFLVPISACILILGKVHKLMVRLTAPLADWLPMDTIAGIALARLLAVVAILLLCFVAGMFSRSRFVSRMVEKLESGLLQSIPGYTFIRGLTGEIASGDDGNQLTPVLAQFDDVAQIGFRVEELADSRVVIFLPGTPDPWSGSLVVMEKERVQPLDQTMAAAVRHLRALGRGATSLLSTTTATKHS